MRNRTKAREAALNFLYKMDMTGDFFPEIDEIDDYLGGFDDVVRDYARHLISGYLSKRPEINAKLATASRNWALDRMIAIDRNILRLATYELLHTDVPPKVAIDEAVELAKKFSTYNSKKFVNGVLDSIYHNDARYKMAS